MVLELFSSGVAPCGQVDDIALQFATADPPIRAKIASLSRWTFWKNNAARVAGIDDNPAEPRILGESAPDGPFHGVAVLSGEGPMAWVHQDVDLFLRHSQLLEEGPLAVGDGLCDAGVL